MHILQKQFGLIIGIVITLFLIFNGCGQEEIQKLHSENEALKNKVASLEQEISKLKETADYHYQQGMDLMSKEKYVEAKTEFIIVIEKYPTSPLVASAKQQLGKTRNELTKIEAQRIAEEKRLEAERCAEERRQQEEEKYRPRSYQEAIEEWQRFRNNEETYKGTITTWKFKCQHIFSECPYGYLDPIEQGGQAKYSVWIEGPEGFTYQGGALFGKVPVVKEEDWIIVTGKFRYVSSNNAVVLSPIRVKNEGFK